MSHAMPQIQTQSPGLDEADGGLYDHESDAGLGLGRRRAVADWGADDLFHRRERSSRRFAREQGGSDATVTAIEAAPSFRASEEPVATPDPIAPVAADPIAPVRPAARRAPRPHRPAPTVGERIGGRPDRIAAWAVGLGVGLILIAVGTADAAPL